MSQIGGCGPKEPVVEFADVTGKITYQGEPLKKGTVYFQPEVGDRGAGDIQPDGTYSLKGVIGPNTVTVISQDAGEGPSGPEAENRMGTPPKDLIPANYGTNKSGLSFDVKAGANTANFDLQ